VASHTVTQATSNARSRKVKKESGFWDRLLGRPAEPEAPEPHSADEAAPAAAENATDAVTQPYRDRETNPDPVALNLIGLSALAIRDGWSSTRFQDEIRGHLKVLRERAGAELAAGQALVRRGDRVTAAVGHVADAIEAAVNVEVSTGVPANLNTAAMAAGITALAANRHDLTEQTLQFPGPLVTPGMADPRTAEPPRAVEVTQVPAPSHPWDVYAGGTPAAPDRKSTRLNSSH